LQSYGENAAKRSAESAESCAESSKMHHFNGFSTFFPFSEQELP
jgi:hypothetical protein